MRRARAKVMVAAFTLCALVSSALAQPARKLLVLPLDGNAPDAQRAEINASVVKLATAEASGEVTVGDTTFSEAASAVGCVPTEPACAETVRSTLEVDELVYGTANTADGNTTVILLRAAGGASPGSWTAVIPQAAPGSDAEPGLRAAFTVPSAPGPEPSPGSPRARSLFDTRERKLAAGLGAGGALSLALGLALWADKSGLQRTIDMHPTATLADIAALRDVERRAASKALWGNVFVFAGAALVGTAGYFVWKDRKNRRAILAPAPVEQGAGVSLALGGAW